MHRIEVYVIPWNGDHAARDGEHVAALYAVEVRVNDVPFHEENVSINWNGRDFVGVTFHEPSKALRGMFDESEYLMGTNDERLILPVRSIRFREMEERE